MKSEKVGIYARVSTADKGQDPELQLKDLRAYPMCMGPSAGQSNRSASFEVRTRVEASGRCTWKPVLPGARIRTDLGRGQPR